MFQPSLASVAGVSEVMDNYSFQWRQNKLVLPSFLTFSWAVFALLVDCKSLITWLSEELSLLLKF